MPTSVKGSVSFMLQRTLALCLTDYKLPLQNAASVHFSFASSGNRLIRILWRPLLSCVNASRLEPSFRRSVLDVARRICNEGLTSCDVVPMWGIIDWDRTSQAFIQGDREIIYSAGETSWSSDDRQIVAIVLCEFGAHCEILKSILAEGRLIPDTPMLQSLVRRFRLLGDDLASIYAMNEKAKSLPLEWAQKELGAPLKALRSGLDRYLMSRDHKDPFDDYKGLTANLFLRLRHRARRCKAVLKWREIYLRRAVGLGSEGHLSHLQTRSPAHLFELWCFVEVAYALLARGFSDVSQCSALKAGTKAPKFIIDNERPVYFNFFGESVDMRRARKIHRETHVEWFIVNRRKYSESVVIDTKYKEWGSEDSLKVLGYMNDFSVDRGVVIFSGEIPMFAAEPLLSQEGIVVCQFGDDGRRRFCAMTLRPHEAYLERNSMVLTILIDTLLKPDC